MQEVNYNNYISCAVVYFLKVDGYNIFSRKMGEKIRHNLFGWLFFFSNHTLCSESIRVPPTVISVSMRPCIHSTEHFWLSQQLLNLKIYFGTIGLHIKFKFGLSWPIFERVTDLELDSFPDFFWQSLQLLNFFTWTYIHGLQIKGEFGLGLMLKELLTFNFSQ